MPRFSESNKIARRQPFGRSLLLRTAYGTTVASAWPGGMPPAWHKKNAIRATAFKLIQEFFKYLPPWEHDVYLEMAKEGPFLPRDFWTMQAYGRFLAFTDQNGVKLVPLRAMTDVSESLDVISQQRGAILARAENYWRPVFTMEEGWVLTSQGPDLPPIFAPNTGGGGGDSYRTPPVLSDFTEAGKTGDIVAANAQLGGITVTYDEPSFTATNGKLLLKKERAADTNILEFGMEPYFGSSRWCNVFMVLYNETENEAIGIGYRSEGTAYKAETHVRSFVNFPVSPSATERSVKIQYGDRWPFYRAEILTNEVKFYFGFDPGNMMEAYTWSKTDAGAFYDQVGLFVWADAGVSVPQQIVFNHLKEWSA